MIKEYSLVKSMVEKEGYPAGTIYPVGTMGVVVYLHRGGVAYEVEVWDEDNYPIDVVTYEANEVREVPEDEYWKPEQKIIR